ncbi:cngb1 [Pungitius sinensis]
MIALLFMWHSVNIVQNKTDLVLEDMGQDEDKGTNQREDVTAETALTQVDRSSPPMDSMEKEAGDLVLAHMEDRLQQERLLEAARVAEEMARKAAEEAARQLGVEHSAKIVMETLPESNEQLPNILEEENEDDPEQEPLPFSSRSLMDVCPADETLSPTQVEPASERRDLDRADHQTITQQPEPEAPVSSPTDQDDAADSGCGVPNIFSPIKSFVLRFPHVNECLESCRNLMHEHDLAAPKLSLPPELLQLTRELSQRCISTARRFTCIDSNSHDPQQP